MAELKRYFFHHSKTTLMRLLSMLIIGVLVTIMTVSDGCGRTEPQYNISSIYILSVIMGICVSVMPVFEFSAFYSKRNLDTMFSLPMSRCRLALVHFVNGYLQTALIFTCCTLSGVFVMLPYAESFKLQYIVPYYFTILAVGFIVYCVVCFIFLQANAVIDGIVFVCFWIVNLYLLCQTLWHEVREYLFARPYPDFKFEHLVMYEQIDNFTVYFQDIININSRVKTLDYIDYLYFCIWVIVGILCIVGIFTTFKNKKTEHVGEVSNSIFGYKLNIPLLYFTLAVLTGDGIINVWLFIFAMIGYFIYRRSFRLKKADLIMLAIFILFGILI